MISTLCCFEFCSSFIPVGTWKSASGSSIDSISDCLRRFEFRRSPLWSVEFYKEHVSGKFLIYSQKFLTRTWLVYFVWILNPKIRFILASLSNLYLSFWSLLKWKIYAQLSLILSHDLKILVISKLASK